MGLSIYGMLKLVMHVSLMATMTADGRIAEDEDQNSTRWASKQDTAFFVKRTKQAGVVIMGSTTFATINKPLSGRLTLVYTRQPEKLADFDAQLVRPVSDEPAVLVKKLAKEGHKELVVCGGTSVYTQFMKARLVSRVYLTVEPIFWGHGMTLFEDQCHTKLNLVEVHRLSSQTIVLEYDVIK